MNIIRLCTVPNNGDFKNKEYIGVQKSIRKTKLKMHTEKIIYTIHITTVIIYARSIQPNIFDYKNKGYEIEIFNFNITQSHSRRINKVWQVECFPDTLLFRLEMWNARGESDTPDRSSAFPGWNQSHLPKQENTVSRVVTWK